MCIPAAAIPATVGAFTAISSSITSIASFAQSQAAYSASQRAYRQQLALNSQAANRAYAAEQQKLNAQYAQASQQAQERMLASLRQKGQILASGRQGQSIGLLMTDAERTYGRDLATMGLNLGYAQQDYSTAVEGIFIDQLSADRQAAAARVPKPSPIGLIGGLVSSGIGGYQAYSSLQAPSPYITTAPKLAPAPTPSPTP